MSHKPAKPIKEQILDIIQKRKDRLNLEINEFADKKRAESVYWGGGGNVERYQRCIDKREEEIRELDALKNNYGGDTYDKVKHIRYRYRCSHCGLTFDTRWQIGGNHVECPGCSYEVAKETEECIELDVIVPPMPSYYDDRKEWRQNFE